MLTNRKPWPGQEVLMFRLVIQESGGRKMAKLVLVLAVAIPLSTSVIEAAEKSPNDRAIEALEREAQQRRERAREREREREQMHRQRELEERRQRELQERQQRERMEAMGREQQQREALAAQAARERARLTWLADQRERLERERLHRDDEWRRQADRNRLAPVVPMVARPAPPARKIAAGAAKPAKVPIAKAPEVVPEPLGEAELAAALKDLDSGDPKRISGALGKLGKAQADGDRALVAGKIIEHLDKAHPAERRLASKALEVWAVAAQVPQLLDLLTDDDREVRLPAIHVLGELKDARAIVPLAGRLVVADDRNAAAKALSQFDAAVEPAVLGHLEHEDQWVRTTTINLLGVVGGEASIVALKVAAEHDKSELVRSKARAALRAVESRTSS